MCSVCRRAAPGPAVGVLVLVGALALSAPPAGSHASGSDARPESSTSVTVQHETFVDETRPSPASNLQPAAPSRTLETTIAFPTMQPVYANQPLTEDEVASLVAFIGEAPQQGATGGSSPGKLVGLAFAVIGGLALLALVVWRGRLIAVRRPLVSRSTSRHR